MYGFTNILIFLGLLFFAVVVIFKRDYGIYLIILLLPAYQIRFSVFGIPATFLEGMILILAAREILHLWDGVGEIAWQNFLILLFLLAALISVFVSPVRLKAAGIFKAYFFEAMLFYFLTLKIVDGEKKLNRLFSALAILAIYVSAFGVYQFLTLAHLPFSWWGVEVASRRIISVLNHPNALALLLGPILAMLTFWPRKTKLIWIALALGIIAFYLSFSRAAWLAVIITIFALSPFISLPRHGEGSRERSNHWIKILSYLLVTVMVILAIPYSRAILAELLRGNAPTQENRYVLWSAGLDMLKKSPLLGAGLMGFHEAYKNYPLGPDRVVQNYPHNFFLNFWVETGLLGLLSIIGLLVLFYRKIYLSLKTPLPSPPHQDHPKNQQIFWEPDQGEGNENKNSSPLVGEGRWGVRPIALAAAAGMAVILLHGQVDVPYFKNDLSVLFWLIYALPSLGFLTK